MKIAVVVLGKIQKWQSETISRVAEIQNVELTLVKLENTDRESGKGLSRWLYDVYCKIDTKFFSVAPVALSEATVTPSNEAISGVFHVDVRDGLENAHFTIFKKTKLDLILNLTVFDLSSSKFLSHSKTGMLQIQFGHKMKPPSTPIGFWEVFKKAEEIWIRVFLVGNSFKNTLLYEGSSLVKYKSVSRTNNIFFWKIPGIIEREVLKIHSLKNKFSPLVERSGQKENRYRSVLGQPSIIQMISFLMIMSLRIAKSAITGRLNMQQWILLFDFRSSFFSRKEFQDFIRLIPPKDRYWADPFVYVKDDRNYIFIEEVQYSDKKGYISVIEIHGLEKSYTPLKVLEEDFHLSYPFLIEEKGQLYMIPESSEKREIRIYKCIEFPTRWEFVQTLMKDVIAVDSTVIHHNDTYYMFTNIASHEGTSTYDELFLFYSDNLLNDNWTSHPNNPVVTDVKNARPAGNIYKLDGKLYRPSQNCTIRYGYGMQINQILELTKTHYKEKVIESVYPDWQKDLLATHTINSKKDFMIIDALIKRTF